MKPRTLWYRWMNRLRQEGLLGRYGLQEIFSTLGLCVYLFPHSVAFNVWERTSKKRREGSSLYKAKVKVNSTNESITCKSLPPNTSSLLWAMSQSFSISCKEHYRRKILIKCLGVEPSGRGLRTQMRPEKPRVENKNIQDIVFNFNNLLDTVHKRPVSYA